VGSAPARSAPLSALAPGVLAAGGYLVATLVWVAGGAALPGGRWFAVHLFTAGVVTNLILVFSHHFAETLMHTPGGSHRRPRLVLANIGALVLLVGLPGGWQPLVALGGTALVAAVCWLYVDLRRMRRSALAGRFGFVVRSYERACGAFTHGALLGVLMGVGVLGGTWYAAARVAHLHINILGWGGLVLLATLVFFGPTVMRTRMEEGADAVGATALKVAATALTLATLGLLATGAGAPVELPARLLAAAGLAVYAAAATAVCLPVLRAGRRAKPSLSAWHLQAACVWFLVAVWIDAAVVAAGAWRLLDALGAVLLVGVLAQAILAAVAYFAPMVWGVGPDARAAARRLLTVAAPLRVAAANIGVVLVAGAAVVGPAAGVAGGWALRGGWALLAAVAIAQIGLTAYAGTARPIDEGAGPRSPRPIVQ
jgi:hypothetical protein